MSPPTNCHPTSTPDQAGVEVVVSFCPCSNGFSPSTLVFLPPQTQHFHILIGIWVQWKKSYYMDQLQISLSSPSSLLFCFVATYVHQTSDGTSYVITSEPTTFDTNSSVSMTTISESNAALVSTSETVDTSGIPLEQFTTHHTHQVDHEDHSTLFVLQDDAGGQDQEV